MEIDSHLPASGWVRKTQCRHLRLGRRDRFRKGTPLHQCCFGRPPNRGHAGGSVLGGRFVEGQERLRTEALRCHNASRLHRSVPARAFQARVRGYRRCARLPSVLDLPIYSSAEYEAACRVLCTAASDELRSVAGRNGVATNEPLVVVDILLLDVKRPFGSAGTGNFSSNFSSRVVCRSRSRRAHVSHVSHVSGGADEPASPREPREPHVSPT